MFAPLKRLIAVFFRRVIGRYYLVIAAMSLLVSGLAVWVIATQWNINSDFKALLPQTTEAYQAMDEVGDRAGSGSALFAVVDSPDAEANRRFAEAYSEALVDLDEVALAHYHNDKSFFDDHQLLYLEATDLRTLHDRIEEKIRRKKKEANPLFVSLDEDEEESSGIQTGDIEARYSDQAHREYKEYLESDDGYSISIVVRFVESSTNLEATNRLLEEVERVGHQLDPQSYHPQMQLEYGGGLVSRQQEYSSILSDVRTSAFFTLFGLFLIISLYFRRFRAVGFVLLPLIMAVLWTLALGFLSFGELTTVTVFIFAILLGLGIDFSIHLLSGYNHLRAEQKSPVEALVECYQTTGKATVIGAFTTFVTFVVLSFAQFRGLSQFGQVAAMGVICMLLAMVVVLPSLILTVQRFVAHQPAPPGKSLLGWLPSTWFEEGRFKGRASVFVGAALALSAVAAWQMTEVEFEENFRRIGEIHGPGAEQPPEEEQIARKLARREGRETGELVDDHAALVRREVDPESFEQPREQETTGEKWTSAAGEMQSSTPTVLLFDEADDARRVFGHMEQMQREGELDAIRSFGSIYAFMPGDESEQKERLEEMERIEQMLEDEDLSVLDDEDRQQVEELSDRLEVEPVDIYDLPPWTKRLFKEAGPLARQPADGEEFAFEYLIYVNSGIDSMVGAEARRYLGQLQKVRETSGVDFRIGSQSYIYVAMLDEIKDEGVVMMGIALAIVFLILSLVFRHPLRGLVALTPLIVGAVWMFGIAGFMGIRLDFFNVIVLPVIIGIGVDDGVHFYYHYRHLGPGAVPEVVRKVGGAVMMTSITSMIGFGGLAVTSHDGLQSIGHLAILGIGTTFLATVLVLPAVLWLGEKYGIEWLVGNRK